MAKYQHVITLVILSSTFSSYPMSKCEASTNSTISVYADILQWIYKVEDSKIYRRLYNGSTGEWIGDWIYVGEQG